MKLRVNGEEREVEAGITVAQLLQTLGFDSVGVAVAVDRQVVPRGRYSEHTLDEGDEVELIRAVGGG